MKISQIINVANIGEVAFSSNARARRITITIRPGRGIRVSIPPRGSLEAALEFVHKKEKWIKKNLAVIDAHREQQKEINDAFLSVDKKEAEKKIKLRLRELTVKHGFKYGKVSIRNQRTRWGSCAGNCNLTFNIKLAVLPEELMDYVIFHELVHTKVHNHSKKFWEELDKYVGSGKAKAKILKEYGLGIL